MQQNFIEPDVPTFPVINGATNTFGASKYWAHEVGVNEVDAMVMLPLFLLIFNQEIMIYQNRDWQEMESLL
jgi:SPX domain protein involved in polyphosphate accumulation